MEKYLPYDEAVARVKRLQAELRKANAVGMLVTHNIGLLYFFGSMQSGYGFVPASGEPLFYVKRSVVRASQESVWPVRELGSLRNLGERLAADYPQLAQGQAPLVLAELDVLPAQSYLKLQELLPQLLLGDGSALVRQVRAVKSGWELAKISQAAAVVNAALSEALNELRAGISELQWMAALEYQLRIRGHAGIMRMRGYNQEIVTGMVASGEAAAEPTYFDGPAGGRGLNAAIPQSSSLHLIQRDEPILIDIGCCIDGYVIDQTRTAVIGSLPDDLTRAYELSVEILHGAEQRLAPGQVSEQLYFGALQQAEAAGLAGHFMGYGADQVRFLGHGIGLEIDEWPVLARGFTRPLEAGHVLAIEPKFTFPGRGVVGIENTYAITAQGMQQLTIYPDQLIVLP